MPQYFPFEHLGWGRYSNSGERYRRWKFTEGCKELKAEAGDVLHDRGPEYGDKRFQVDHKDEAKRRPLIYEPQTVADAVFGGHIPIWDPPSEGGGNSAGMSSVAEAEIVLAATRIALALTTISNTYTKANATEEKEHEKPHPRGVYSFEGEGRWDRDLLVAYDSNGKIIAKREVEPDESEESIVAFASRLQRQLDRVDPELDLSPDEWVERLLRDELPGIAKEANADQYLDHQKQTRLSITRHKARRHAKRTIPRTCADCGEQYTPERINSRRCSGCLDEKRSARV